MSQGHGVIFDIAVCCDEKTNMAKVVLKKGNIWFEIGNKRWTFVIPVVFINMHLSL